MIGMSVGYRRNLHYGVDFLAGKASKKYAIVLKRIVYFLMLLTCVFMLYLSISITSQGFIKVSAYFGIPYFYNIFSWAVIGFALMLSIHCVIWSFHSEILTISSSALRRAAFRDWTTKMTTSMI